MSRHKDANEKYFRWVMAAPKERQHWDNEVYWGLFYDNDDAPFALYRTRTEAEEHATELRDSPGHNTEIDVSPCIADLTARNNYKVPS